MFLSDVERRPQEKGKGKEMRGLGFGCPRALPELPAVVHLVGDKTRAKFSYGGDKVYDFSLLLWS